MEFVAKTVRMSPLGIDLACLTGNPPMLSDSAPFCELLPLFLYVPLEPIRQRLGVAGIPPLVTLFCKPVIAVEAWVRRQVHMIVTGIPHPNTRSLIDRGFVELLPLPSPASDGLFPCWPYAVITFINVLEGYTVVDVEFPIQWIHYGTHGNSVPRR